MREHTTDALPLEQVCTRNIVAIQIRRSSFVARNSVLVVTVNWLQHSGSAHGYRPGLAVAPRGGRGLALPHCGQNRPPHCVLQDESSAALGLHLLADFADGLQFG